MELYLTKRGSLFNIFSKEYDLLCDGGTASQLRFDSYKSSSFSVNQQHYVIRADGKGRWILDSDGTTIAQCQRQTTGPQLSFTISFDGQSWQTKPVRQGLLLTHELWDGQRQIALITPKMKLWSNAVIASFNDSSRLEIAGFMLWLFGIHWVGISGPITAARAENGL